MIVAVVILAVLLAGALPLSAGLYAGRNRWAAVAKRCEDTIRGLTATQEALRIDLAEQTRLLAASRAAGEDIAHRLAACDAERIDRKAQFAKLAGLCRQLETKLKDCTDPPISRAKLTELTRLVASLRAERDGSLIEIAKLQAEVERTNARLEAAESPDDRDRPAGAA